MLDQLEDNACEKQQVESKVTNTVRRASVIADPARTAEAIAELDTVKFSSDEAAQTVNETWTRRMNRSESLSSFHRCVLSVLVNNCMVQHDLVCCRGLAD